MRIKQANTIMAVFLLLSSVSGVTADTTVGGSIAVDTHWTVADSPYVVASDIALDSGATLTIDPGVEVRFDPEMRLKVNSGTFIARGTEMNRIRFTANTTGQVQDADRWNAIWFSDGTVDATLDTDGSYVSGSIIEYATIEYAGQGATLNTTWPSFYAYDGEAVYMGHAAPLISNSIFRYNARGAIGAYRSTGEVHIVGNVISENTDRALDLSHSVILLKDNEISNNVSAEAHAGGVKIHYCTITFSGNTITNNATGRTTGNYAGGIHSQGSVVHMTGDRIVGNVGGGLVCDSYASSYENEVILSTDPNNPTWIFNNGAFDVRNAMSFGSFELSNDHNVDARNAWWGTLDEVAIQTGIDDYFDNSSRGIVVYSPWAIPEPATLLLLFLGGLVLAKRRVRRGD